MDQMRTHGGNPWELMRAAGLSRAQVVDFSVDINPLGFPPRVRSIILDHVEAIQDYPDPSARALREALAAFHQVPAEAILPGNGSAELITLVAHLRPFTKALVVAPTFTEYALALEPLGVEVVSLTAREADSFEVDESRETWDRLLQTVDAVFLCNPNNPTGTVLPKDRVLKLAQWCQARGALLVVDEAYAELTDRPDEVSIASEAPALGDIIVLRSLTKAFAVPGLRLGYLIASPDLVEALRARQSAWPLNTFALAVGPHLVDETDYLARSRQAIAQWRAELVASLQAVDGLRPFPSVTNFLLCKLMDPALDASSLASALAPRGILIRVCDDFTGLESGRFIRLAVRRPEENERLAAALHEELAHAC